MAMAHQARVCMAREDALMACRTAHRLTCQSMDRHEIKCRFSTTSRKKEVVHGELEKRLKPESSSQSLLDGATQTLTGLIRASSSQQNR